MRSCGRKLRCASFAPHSLVVREQKRAKVGSRDKALNKLAWREKKRTIIALSGVVLVIAALLFTDLNHPSGEGVLVHGTTTQVLYIIPRLGNSYTSFTVKLDNGEMVKAEGPPNLPVKRGAGVVLLRRSRVITGSPVYEFDGYEK